jgi:hypothetical protein
MVKQMLGEQCVGVRADSNRRFTLKYWQLPSRWIVPEPLEDTLLAWIIDD